ncbi:MAG: heme ABC transporter ATP-binding protein [Pseudomonadota bacterium]
MSLTCDGVDVFVGKTQILHEVSMAAAPGQVTAIVGPNGCGKTTLLRAMTRELPYTGAVAMNGENIATRAPEKLATERAVLPQSTNLAFPFNVLEVVRLGLTAGLSTNTPEQNEALPSRALERVGLSGFESRFYQELSGGEKQRVQLARVLVQVWDPVLNGTPRWLFLDEPVSALDIAHQLLVMDIAQDFARAGGGVVAVMHDLNLTAMFAHHVVLMARGRVLKSGTPDDVIENNALSDAYNCRVRTRTPPSGNAPWLVPHASRLAEPRLDKRGDTAAE